MAPVDAASTTLSDEEVAERKRFLDFDDGDVGHLIDIDHVAKG